MPPPPSRRKRPTTPSRNRMPTANPPTPSKCLSAAIRSISWSTAWWCTRSRKPAPWPRPTVSTAFASTIFSKFKWTAWRCRSSRAARSLGLHSCRVAVKLRPDGVGVVVVAAAVGVDRPEHGADHAGVAFGLAQLVRGFGRSLAGDDVVHRLVDDAGRRVPGEEADGHLIGRHRREELLGVASERKRVV